MIKSNLIFDKTKCKNKLYKGYTGCMCGYCQEFKSLLGFWETNIKGNYKSFEISVLRENNRHGKASWGWFDEHKIFVSSNSCAGTKWYTTEEMFNSLIIVANEYAIKLNKNEI